MDDLKKLYLGLNADEKKVVDVGVIIILHKAKQNTVSDEAMAGFIKTTTEFVDLMKVVKKKFDSVAQTSDKVPT